MDDVLAPTISFGDIDLNKEGLAANLSNLLPRVNIQRKSNNEVGAIVGEQIAVKSKRDRNLQGNFTRPITQRGR